MDPQIYRQSTSLMMKTTFLYYEKGLSQSKISKKLNISISTVSRLLNNAKKEKMVSFVVDEKVLEVADLEEIIKEKFNLKDVIIARWMEKRFTPEKDDIKKLVAFEGAQYIQRIIKDNDILGITFGRTMYHMINSFNPCKKTDTQFVTLHGSLDKIHRDFNVDTLTERMAMSFGGKNYTIKAPGHANTEYEAKMLINRIDNHEVFEKFKNVNIVVSGVGSFYPDMTSYLCNENYFSQKQLEELKEQKVYADVGLRLINEQGEECNTSLKNRTIRISYEDFKNIPTKIIIVSGEYKKYSVKAAVKGGLADVLIIDYDLAKSLINI